MLLSCCVFDIFGCYAACHVVCSTYLDVMLLACHVTYLDVILIVIFVFDVMLLVMLCF